MTTATMHERDVEKIAWGVLLGAFALFLVLLFGIPAAIYWYLNTATDVHDSNLTVLSGTVIVDVPGRDSSGERATRLVPESSTIRTDATSRVNLTLFDGSTVIVFPDTQLTLNTVRTPKFSMSTLPAQVGIELHSGRIRLSVVQSADLHEVRAGTPQGESFFGRGDYLVEVANDQMDVVVRSGQAHVRGQNVSLALNARERALLKVGQPPRGPLPAERDLLANGAFTDLLKDTWQVYNDQGGDGPSINGTVTVTDDQGHHGVRFQRQGSNGNHNETGIVQQVGKDVSDAEIIRLRADLLVAFQSLSGGGYLSSEYPVMIKIRYRDIKGGENIWVRGFYYQNDTHSQTNDGEQVKQGLWYPYESPNLADVLNPKPAQILSVAIYASGWDFDSMVSDVGLIIE
jgi:FecR-like protein